MAILNVLFVDSYDSFTYNLVRLIEQQQIEDGPDEEISTHVTTIHNDTFKTKDQLRDYLKYFDCVVVGPGPGNPVNGSQDVGIISSLFEDNEFKDIPILGVCLGFQALCYSQGALVSELNTIKHGQVYEMTVERKEGLFKGYPEVFNSVRYHSLHVSDPPSSVIPLAYTNDENGRLLMAARIQNTPWYGVQYHPESCCSDSGALLIQNFLSLAQESNMTTGRLIKKIELKEIDPIRFDSILSNLENKIDHSCIYDKQNVIQAKKLIPKIQKFEVGHNADFTLKLCDKIDAHKFIMASSSISPNRGEWSIITLPSDSSSVFTHYNDLQKTTIHKWRDPLLNVETLRTGLETLQPFACLLYTSRCV